MTDLSAACLADFKSAFQTLPIQRNQVGLNFHSVSDSSKYFLTEFSSNVLKSCSNFLLTCPLLALKRLKAKRNESVDKPLHSSICIALVVKHVTFCCCRIGSCFPRYFYVYWTKEIHSSVTKRFTVIC